MRQVLRVIVAVLVVLASGELFVRLFMGGPSPQVYDAEIGYAYLPHSELFQAKEGQTRLKFNALGLNDREVDAKNGRCRVLAVGDSYTAALQVRAESNFTSVAERLDPRLDVVNGGRDGLFLGDLHKVARRITPAADPDLIVYVISERAVEVDVTLPQFRIVFDPATGEITDAIMEVEQQENLKRVFGPVLNRSALATRLSAQLKPAVVDAIQQLETLRNRKKTGGEAPASPMHRQKPAPEEVLAFLFTRFASERPAALLFINGLSYSADGGATVASTSLVAEELARKAADLAGVPMRSTSSYLVEAMARSGQPPYGFDNALLPGGHLNELGHEAVAQALVDLVREARPQSAPECGGS